MASQGVDADGPPVLSLCRHRGLPSWKLEEGWPDGSGRVALVPGGGWSRRLGLNLCPERPMVLDKLISSHSFRQVEYHDPRKKPLTRSSSQFQGNIKRRRFLQHIAGVCGGIGESGLLHTSSAPSCRSSPRRRYNETELQAALETLPATLVGTLSVKCNPYFIEGARVRWQHGRASTDAPELDQEAGNNFFVSCRSST